MERRLGKGNGAENELSKRVAASFQGRLCSVTETKGRSNKGLCVFVAESIIVSLTVRF